MVSTVSAESEWAEERVIVRMTAADPRSEWSHGLSAGLVSLTDSRIVFHAYGTRRGADDRRWELSLDDVERVTTTPVPIWLLGVARIWLRGVRVATSGGRGKTFILRGARATDFVAAFEGVRKARRRSGARVDTSI
jgi:hypothetical protein